MSEKQLQSGGGQGLDQLTATVKRQKRLRRGLEDLRLLGQLNKCEEGQVETFVG